MERLGLVNSEKWWDFCEMWRDKFEDERWNGKVNSSGRECIWFGKGVDLGFRSRVFEGWLKFFVDDSDLNFDLGFEWDSLLVYRYGVGCELLDHVDRDVFEREVYIINLCKGFVGFRYGGEVNWLYDGELIKIDSGVRHGVCRVEEERFSLSFRKIR